MGSAWSNPAHQTGTAQNFDPNQMAGWNQFSQGAKGGQMPGAFDITQNPMYADLFKQIQGQMSPYGSPQFEQQFQQGFVNPAMKSYEQEVLPQLRSQFYSPTASYGAGLNQAINKSAENLQSGLGELRAKYGMSQQQSGIANALGLMQQQMGAGQNYWSTLFGASPTSAIVQGPQSGWGKDIATLLAQIAASKVGAK